MLKRRPHLSTHAPHSPILLLTLAALGCSALVGCAEPTYSRLAVDNPGGRDGGAGSVSGPIGSGGSSSPGQGGMMGGADGGGLDARGDLDAASTGGTPPAGTGGTAGGGENADGSASGGAETGGATGGSATGGLATGGTPTGGLATGGAAVGGAPGSGGSAGPGGHGTGGAANEAGMGGATGSSTNGGGGAAGAGTSAGGSAGATGAAGEGQAAGGAAMGGRGGAAGAAGGTSGITVVGVDFVGGTGEGGSAPTPLPEMEPGEVAGYKPAAHWNAAPGTTGALSSVQTSDGGTLSVDISWTSPSSGSNPGVWRIGYPDEPGNVRMMNGYLDPSSTGAPASVKIASLPPPFATGHYDVYVYVAGAFLSSSTRVYRYTLGSTSIDVTQTGPTPTTFTGYQLLTASGTGNVIVFRNVTGTAFTLTATPVSGPQLRAPVNGLQIVFPSGS